MSTIRIPSQPILFTILAGIAAGLVFFIASYSVLAGFLTAIPLFLIGFAYGAKHSGQAILIACILITLAADIGSMVFFLGFVSLPAQHFIRKSLLWREEDSNRQWYPITTILAELVLIAAILFLMVSFLAHLQGIPSIQLQISDDYNANFKNLDPEMQHIMKRLMGEWSFLVFALSGWIWVLLLYGLALMAQSAVAARGMALRPSLALTLNGLPMWLPVLLVFSVLLVAFGRGGDRFSGEVVSLLLLLPYFLNGLLWVHYSSQDWKARALWLSALYAGLFIFAWPGLLVIGIGLYLHAAEILDKRHRIG
jgi:hypothetical protein